MHCRMLTDWWFDSNLILWCFNSTITITIRGSLLNNMLRNSVFHDLWGNKIEIKRRHIFVFWICFYKWRHLVTGSQSFPCGCNVVSIQFRKISSQHQGSLKTFRGLWGVGLVNDPGPSGIILNIGRILTRNIRFFVTIKWILNQFTSDFFKLFLCINQPPFKAFSTLCSI